MWNLVLEMSSNYAHLWREDKSGAIYLERSLLNYSSVMDGKSLCIVDKCVKVGTLVSLN